MARVRITIGRALLAIAFIATFHALCCTDELLAQSALVKTANASAPAKLVVAENHSYTTDAVAAWLSADDPVPQPTLVFGDCTYRGNTRTLAFGQAVRLERVGTSQCAQPGHEKEIYLIDSPTPLAKTIVRFDDGTHSNTLVIPPIGAIASGATRTLGPIVNDGTFRTTVTVFADKLTRVFIDVVNGDGATIASEQFDAFGVTQYVIAKRLDIGSLRIQTGAYIGTIGDTYGFVDVSPDIGAGLVIPF